LRARHTRGRRGFTLIEILAVVLIIGLTFGFFLPNLDATRVRRLETRAREVAALVQVTRERAIVTGAPHRLVLDLESGAMRMEWFVDEDRALRAAGAEEWELEREPADDGRSRQPVSLVPPEAAERSYYPVPNKFGETMYLPETYRFVGVETPEDGFIDQGEVQIVFGRDGTTDYAEIIVADDHDNEVVLEVHALLDAVRLRTNEDGAW
jgi:prepilin-type N-terminal cleavage/methylation domain-containing protein